MISLYLLLSAHQTPDLDRKIDFVCEGMRLERFVKEFGAAAKVKFAVAPNLVNELLCVRLKAVSVLTAMRRIETALDATWNSTDDGFRLSRSSTQNHERQARNLRNFTKYFAEKQAKFKKELIATRGIPDEEYGPRAAKMATLLINASKQTLDDAGAEKAYSEFHKLYGEEPPENAVKQIIGTLDPQILGQFNLRQTAVFSTRPNAMQRPMPKSVTPILNEMLRKSGRWFAALSKAGIPITDATRGLLAVNFDPARVAKINLIVQQSSWMADTDFQMEILADSGEVLYTTSHGFETDAESEAPTVIKWMRPIWPQEPTITLPETGRVFVETFRRRRSATSAALPAALETQFLNPEQVDPAEYLYTPLFTQLAEIEQKNLVLVPSDTLFIGVATTLSKQSLTPAKIKPILFSEYVEVTDSDGWLTVRPRFPVFDSIQRTDRARLGEFVRAWRSDRSFSLDEIALYEGYTSNAPFDFIAFPLTRVLAGSSPAVSMDQDGALARFYCSLTPLQRDAMASDGITFGSLSPEQQRLVRFMVFDNALLENSAQEFEGAEFSKRTKNPTELFPNGIPINMRLSLKRSGETKIMPKATPAPFSNARTNMWDAGTAASVMASLEQPNSRPRSVTYSFDRVNVVNSQEVEITFHFSPNLLASQTLSYADCRESKEVAWNELPEAFRTQVDQYKKIYQERRNQSAGKVPPPR